MLFFGGFMDLLQELRKELDKRKKEIQNRLREFKENWQGNEKIFSELAFCLCTPQSNAKKCDAAVRKMRDKKCLLKGNESEIKKCLKPRVRFHNNKTKNILRAREFFSENSELKIRKKLKEQGIEVDHRKVREWLVKNVRGLGLKEASHFLRNIGFYENIAILDRHILRNLKGLGIIEKLPASLNKEKYYSIEKKLLRFCKQHRLKPEEFDLVLWARETGFLFK